MSMEIINRQDYINETLELTKNIQVSFLELGKRLSKIRDEEVWSGTHSSFAEFLDFCDLTESGASKLINIYQTFILREQIPEQKVLKAGVGKLGEVLRYAKDSDTALRIVELAQVLPTRELKRALKEEYDGVIEDCPHLNTYQINICRDCGNKI